MRRTVSITYRDSRSLWKNIDALLANANSKLPNEQLTRSDFIKVAVRNLFIQLTERPENEENKQPENSKGLEKTRKLEC